MRDKWQPKPGDRVLRPRRGKHSRLRRVLGIPSLFSAGFGDVGSSIYYALGVVALVALGATPVALVIAGIIFIFNSLTYAEGGAMVPEAGGSATFARYGFNDLGGFVSGWALILSYIATIAISAYTIPPYLSYFWPALKDPIIGTTFSMGVIVILILVNIIGIKESTRLNLLFIVFVITTQLVLVIIGFALILVPNPQDLIQHMFGAGNWPSTASLIFGISIASLCFTGVETIAQLAEETRHPEKKIPRAYMLLIVAVFTLFTGISVVALAAMTPQVLGDPVNGWARDPVAGVAANLPYPFLSTIFAPLVAIAASGILFGATNAGVLGSSRLVFNLATQRQFPAVLSGINHRFRTPHVAIVSFSGLAIILLIPGFFFARFFADLGALYVFGSLLSFAIAHASILSLRWRQPDLPRSFRLRWNISFKGRQLPVTAILGLLATSTIWVTVVSTEPISSGLAGGIWMIGGFIIYYFYRRRAGLPLTQTPTIETHTEV